MSPFRLAFSEAFSYVQKITQRKTTQTSYFHKPHPYVA